LSGISSATAQAAMRTDRTIFQRLRLSMVVLV